MDSFDFIKGKILESGPLSLKDNFNRIVLVMPSIFCRHFVEDHMEIDVLRLMSASVRPRPSVFFGFFV